MPNPIPEIIISLARAKGAPAKPQAAELKAAFLRTWALIPPRRCPEAFKHTRVSVNVRLIGDDEIAPMNKQFMNHDGPTDVLSFPMLDADPERGTFHIGDIVASFETAQREANQRGISVEEVLTRYCVHGFLHCLGYDDSTPAKRRSMFSVQEKAVKTQGK